MQKLILLPLLICLFFSTANAQRYVDIQITLYAPETADTIYTDNPFQIAFSIKNNGLDTVWFSDSLAFELLFDGSPISFGQPGGGMIPYLPLTGQELVPGDSVNIGFNFTIMQGWDTGDAEICVGVRSLNTADTLHDTLQVNNMSCADITIMDPVSVFIAGAESVQEDIKVYPNPASNLVRVTSNTIIDRVELYNMQGQKLISRQPNQSGTDLDVHTLPSGIYILKVGEHFVSRIVKE